MKSPAETSSAIDSAICDVARIARKRAAARAPDGSAAAFLLDEVLEVRTFESFPGLRTVLPDLLAALADTPNRFVLATRFFTRARRLFDGAPARFELHQLPPLDGDEVQSLLADAFAGSRAPLIDDATARAVHALTCGHRGHVHLIASQMAAMSREGAADPLSALAALLSPGGRLSDACQYCYEFRLHRARGYGALKAILDVLAEEEPLTLTGISQRLRRTPGSTKDYLSWLEDVDLVHVARKRYRIADPLLRLWLRLSGRPEPPGEEDVAREVHLYALERLGGRGIEPAGVLAGVPGGRGDIIEFD